MTIAVCMKWVALRPDVDPLTGSVTTDDRWSGPSPADCAALETALRIAGDRGTAVQVFTVAGPSADAMLRDALAAGAAGVTRIEAGEQPASSAVAAALADAIRPLDPALVICGDWSMDRGSGSVPPFLAAELGMGQACGLVGVRTGGESELHAERRLDGGRRERLRITGPSVLSVEGSVATLRRASLASTLAAQSASIDVVKPRHPLHPAAAPHRVVPFRPRARVLDGPATSQDPRSRIETLTGALTKRTPPQKLTLNADDAADAILAKLVEWGYDIP